MFNTKLTLLTFVAIITLCFSLPFVSSIFEEDFDTDASGWTLSNLSGGNSWRWYADQGEGATGGIRSKFLVAGNHVISPLMSLTAGTDYTLIYSAKKKTSSSGRTINASFDTAPTVSGSNTSISSQDLLNDDTWHEYFQTFTVPTTGDYHILLEGVGGAYVFCYLDNFVVEETILPTISWTSPADNAVLPENIDVNLEVNAVDADGFISRVEYFINGNLVGTETTTPFTYTWSNPTPGNYDLQAITYDNRNHEATTTIRTVTVETPAGTVDELMYDFETQSEFWKYEGGWETRNKGINGSVAAYGFNLTSDDFLASPALYLYAGETYTLNFRVDAEGDNRELTAAFNNAQALGGTDLLTLTVNSTDDFTDVKTVDFTVPTDGIQHLIFYCSSGQGYRKIIVDELELIGTHNEGALSILDYNPLGTTNIAEGATFTFNSTVTDNDGSIIQVDFQVDGVTVDTDNSAPYTGQWTSATLGTHQLTVSAIDNEGLANASFPLEVNVQTNTFNSSFIGGAGSDEVRGAVIQNDGTIVLAANLTALPSGVTPTYVNGAVAGQEGMIVRISPNGQTVLSVTVVGDKVVDLSMDAQSRLYVAAGADGFLRLDTNGQTVDYGYGFGLNVHRVDASPSGKAAILLDDEIDYDEVKLLNASVRIYDESGTQTASTSGPTTFTTDVCIDEVSETVISIGFKNVFTDDGDGNINFPVDIPAFKGTDFSGNEKYRGYDWSEDESSPRWLNLPENNMADARGARCEIGQDGMLYIVFEADGGNHCLRYDPFSITTPNSIVGGDAYSEFYNSNTEPKAVIARYNPTTGAILKTQQFCGRLSNTAANTVRTKNGNIAANAAGEVYMVGESASGIPINLEYLPGEYLGGAFVLKLSADFTERQLVTRLTNGAARAVALGGNDGFLYAGNTSNSLYLNNPLQATNAGGIDGWFVSEEASAVLPVEWQSFTAEKADKNVDLNWTTTNERNNAGFYVERSGNGFNWLKVSSLIPPNQSENYTFTDKTIVKMQDYLYRIQLVDLDGKSAYSEIRKVSFKCENEPINIFPNPADKAFSINANQALEKVSLLNARGEILSTFETTESFLNIDVSNYPAGIYWVKGEGIFLRKVIVR